MGELRPLYAGSELPFSIKRLLCHADLVNRLGNLRALSLQSFDLPISMQVLGISNTFQPSLILKVST